MPVAPRAKRHIDEESFKYCKKRKVNETDEQIDKGSNIVHRFTSVAKSQNESRIKRLKSKEEAKESMSKIRNPDLSSRNRQEILLKSQNNRFLVTNCSRTTEIEEKEEELPENSSQIPEETEIVDPVESLLRFVIMFEEMYVSMKLI